MRLRLTASGVNFADVYIRSGLYPAELPCIPGREGIGEVTALGEDVSNWRIGDRAAFVSVTGSYVESRLIEADRLIALPDEIDDITAAAMMLRGMTARVLLHDVGHVRSGDTILVHAAAGGVGLMLTQWAASLGATVIGTVSTEKKGRRRATAWLPPRPCRSRPTYRRCGAQPHRWRHGGYRLRRRRTRHTAGVARQSGVPRATSCPTGKPPARCVP